MHKAHARTLANLVEPNEARDLRLVVGEGVDRAKRPIVRVAVCMKCDAVWKGGRALAAAKDHVVKTRHPCWSLTGTWEMLLPSGWKKEG